MENYVGDYMGDYYKLIGELIDLENSLGTFEAITKEDKKQEIDNKILQKKKDISNELSKLDDYHRTLISKIAQLEIERQEELNKGNEIEEIGD